MRVGSSNAQDPSSEDPEGEVVMEEESFDSVCSSYLNSVGDDMR